VLRNGCDSCKDGFGFIVIGMTALTMMSTILRTSCLVLVLLAPWHSHAGFFKPSWESTYRKIQTDFPAAKQISTAKFLSTYNNKEYILLDIREPSEYLVSHLRGAINAANSEMALKYLQTSDKNIPVIVYCSVGYRSSAVAVDLQAAGYRNVYNLKGGIFSWANESRPLFSKDKLVKQVHPYDRYWGALLNRRYTAKLP
jgi:rhodanese-related sulfurtransferase